MKYYSLPLSLSLFILFFFSSCETEDVTKNTFVITPKVIHAHSATFEVAPITNEFYYDADAVPLSLYNKLGEEGIAEYEMHYYDSLKAVLDKQHIPYDNDYLYYKGMYDCSTYYLPAATPCMFFVIRLSKKTLQPIFPIVTYPFSTPEDITRDMTFTFRFGGNELYIAPSDTFPYLWDYVSKEELATVFDNDPGYYMRSTISMYEEYGFIDSLLTQGMVYENVKEWYPNLQPGDSIYGIAVGYEQNDMTTEIFSKAFVIE